MWFVLALTAIAVIVISGLYVRRRIGQALARFGVRPSRIRMFRWVFGWLLFGYPAFALLRFVVLFGLGRDVVPRFESLAGAYLVTLPFAFTMLVVLQALPWILALDLVALARRITGDASSTTRAAGGGGEPPKMITWGTLIVVAAFALYTPIRVFAERGSVTVRHHDVGRGATTFRIGFVADIQQDVHTDADRAREVYAMISAEKPDVVLSGGDWINTGPDEIERSAAAAGTLTSRLGTFSVRGDHEHFAYRDRERSVGEIEAAMLWHGVAMLANEVRWFDAGGKRIGVAFLNYNYVYRTPPAEIAKLVAQLAGADYRILVTHQFDTRVAALVEGKVDLVLAAHTHGGQINPVVGLVHVPLARIETPYVDGRYQRGATTILVTAGVGYSVLPLRYAAPGSVEIVDVRL